MATDAANPVNANEADSIRSNSTLGRQHDAQHENQSEYEHENENESRVEDEKEFERDKEPEAEPLEDEPKSPMTLEELVVHTQNELDADADRHATLQASAGDLSRASHTGATLDLSRKMLQVLPVEVIELIKDRVERLALSHNDLYCDTPSFLPTDIMQCHRLRYLNLRWNSLPGFPQAVLKLPRLEILDLSRNMIVDIPEEIREMTSLKFLAISHNRIARLPLALGDMTSLSKLRFDENPIEYPPPEAYKPLTDITGKAVQNESEKDVCQRVKRFLKAATLKQRLLGSSAEDDSGEGIAETPRPPKRIVTGGRFPIRPSVSGIENIQDLRSRSPSLQDPSPPSAQRSHSRVPSVSNPVQQKSRVAPLRLGTIDTGRSRPELTSTLSLRQRRQGFVTSRKVTPDLAHVPAITAQDGDRLSSKSTVRLNHSRGNSSVSTLNGFLAASSGGSSSGAVSPVDGASRINGVRRLAVLPENRNSTSQTQSAVKACARLAFTLKQLNEPTKYVANAVKETTAGVAKRSTLERKLFSANAHVDEIDRLLKGLENGFDDERRRVDDSPRNIILAGVHALRSYSAVAVELRRHVPKAVMAADGIYIRNLLIHLYSAVVEARNICTVLHVNIEQQIYVKGFTGASAQWNSKTSTPTQSKPGESLRTRGQTALQSIKSNSTLRAMAPPPPPNGRPNGSFSRTNTMSSTSSATSSFAPTPRSADSSFSAISSSRTDFLRTNTMRGSVDDGEGESQFDSIFIKLRNACDAASQALPHCRSQFDSRKEHAQNTGQSRLASHWALVLTKCDISVAANRELKKRLEVIRLNDPSLRNSREFWQLCDAFVHSWTDLVTEVKEIGSHRTDVATIKPLMRQVQQSVKEASKAISHSSLYHQAVGARAPDSAGSHVSTPGFSDCWSSTSIVGSPNGDPGGYITSVPATPLSAALGPAAQATVANMSHGRSNLPTDYFAQRQNSRSALERSDTVIRPPTRIRTNQER